MELGNIIYGHSRGEHEVPDRTKYRELIQPLLDALGCDSYGMHFVNETFEMHPYCYCDSKSCQQCGTGEQVNFHYKPTNLKLCWYKYAMRDGYTNVLLAPAMFFQAIRTCIASLPPDMVADNKRRAEEYTSSEAVAARHRVRIQLNAKYLRNVRHGARGDVTS